MIMVAERKRKVLWECIILHVAKRTSFNPCFQNTHTDFFVFFSGGVGVGREDLPPKCDRGQLGPNPILYFIIHVN